MVSTAAVIWLPLVYDGEDTMNITVYCGSMTGNAPVYVETAQALGTWMGQNGHTLVFGGGGVGLMGALSDAVLAAGGKAHGVMPSFLVEREASRSGLTTLEVTDSMPERKSRMIELGDAFVALPGGPGTIEEISEIMSLKKLGRVFAPCVLFSVDGYYDELAASYDKMVACGFATPTERAKLSVVSTLPELVQALTRGEDA